MRPPIKILLLNTDQVNPKKTSEIRIRFDLDIWWFIDKNKERGRIAFPYRAEKVFRPHGFICVVSDKYTTLALSLL